MIDAFSDHLMEEIIREELADLNIASLQLEESQALLKTADDGEQKKAFEATVSYNQCEQKKAIHRVKQSLEIIAWQKVAEALLK